MGDLLPITIQGFFPGDDYDYTKLENKEPAKTMTIPLIILTAGAIGVGLFSTPIISYIETILATF